LILGLLITAILASTVVSVTLFAMSWPLWIALIAYPVTGTVFMLVGMPIVWLFNRMLGQKAPASGHFPVQRNTTPTVANSSLTSVVNDNIRS
jgi:hypothetical protein